MLISYQCAHIETCGVVDNPVICHIAIPIQYRSSKFWKWTDVLYASALINYKPHVAIATSIWPMW
jgi:hypothetical protein